MNILTRLFIAALLVAPIAACNTTSGFGEDVEAAGDAVEDAADEVADSLDD